MAIILPVLKGLCQDILNHYLATCKITLFFLIFTSIKFRDFRDFKKFEKFNTRKQKIARNLNKRNVMTIFENKTIIIFKMF